MLTETPTKLKEVLEQSEAEIRAQWIDEQLRALSRAQIKESELREHCGEFLRMLRGALTAGAPAEDVQGPAWSDVRQLLETLSRSRGREGWRPSETALFVLSLKRPLFAALARAHGTNAQGLAGDVWRATALLDRMALLTSEVHQRTREEVIARQQQEMLELSTPVVRLWDGVLAVPLIGTLDSGRTQVVMEALLERIVATNSPIAILDITGVPTVDTLTAQHLLKTVAAARLMGADCIISGIRPQIAQTIVHLGVDLTGIVTKATLADALALAMQRVGFKIGRE